MNRIFIHGSGAVSPAGWGTPALRVAVEKNEPLPTQPLARPGWDKPLWVRQVPPPAARPAFLAHPRLRRASAISQYVIAAALEALGDDAARVQSGSLRLGIVVCVLTGSVSYSRRFFEELLRDPATASPLVFSETVFNAPASHLAAYLGAQGTNYTLVGDNGAYLQGLALAAHWLLNDRADGCVVVGAEEMDWIVADAVRLFQHQAVHGDGAGALYLRAGDASTCVAEMAVVTDSFPFVHGRPRAEAAREMRAQLPACGRDELLLLSTQGLPGADVAEETAWREWTGRRLAPKATLGEAFTASAAWECVLACETLRRGGCRAANVSVVGVNQQAIGARFVSRQC
ncbi:MAG: beta-ketoacyl synthase N-terminal-like domain-containing protein [Limisphaerales bacterium]